MIAPTSGRLIRKHERVLRSVLGLGPPTTTRNAAAVELLAIAVVAVWVGAAAWVAALLHGLTAQSAWACTGFVAVAGSIALSRYIGFTCSPTPAECGSYADEGFAAVLTAVAGGGVFAGIVRLGAAFRPFRSGPCRVDALLLALCLGAAAMCLFEEKLERALSGGRAARKRA
mmetsp:Transcript_419/g.1307  ORF Transcript_419/g.1307 Transcript_419/m.1307 type:complete len:172 (+) Transcript_419:29-544(+)